MKVRLLPLNDPWTSRKRVFILHCIRYVVRSFGVPKLSNGKLPDFLCIGAQKAGTTWLHAVLKHHPEVWLPQRKEIHYFDLRYPPYPTYPDKEAPSDADTNISLNYKVTSRLSRFKKYTPKRLAWEVYYRYFPRSDKWYKNLFMSAKDRMAGDFTPGYAMLDNSAIANVYKLLPNAKIIFIMREPIERAWSHAKMILGQHGYRSISKISEKKFIEFLHSEPSLRRGQYSQIIKRWETFYPAESFLRLYFDDVSENPELLVNKVIDFLGVGPMSEEMHAIIHKEIHKGQDLDIPDTIYLELFELYEQEMQVLASKYGGIAQRWFSNASNKNKEILLRVKGNV